jgi:hypothetical protein
MVWFQYCCGGSEITENSHWEAGIHVQIQIRPFSFCIFIQPSFTSSPKHCNLADSIPASDWLSVLGREDGYLN